MVFCQTPISQKNWKNWKLKGIISEGHITTAENIENSEETINWKIITPFPNFPIR